MQHKNKAITTLRGQKKKIGVNIQLSFPLFRSLHITLLNIIKGIQTSTRRMFGLPPETRLREAAERDVMCLLDLKLIHLYAKWDHAWVKSCLTL